MVDVAEGELEQLVCEDAGGVGEAEQRVVREARLEPHGARVQDRLVAQAAEAGMAVHNLNLLADEDVAQHGEQREHGRERCLAVNHKERRVVHLEPVRQISHTRPVAVRVRDDDHLVPPVDQLRRQLVDVRLDPPRLRVEEVARHGDVVGHFLFLSLLLFSSSFFPFFYTIIGPVLFPFSWRLCNGVIS